jgi:predicted CXXCH cytochrome family protein
MDYAYDGYSTYTFAPGGSYPSSNLSCISCHDPHGIIAKGGAYRLLGGNGYSPSSAEGTVFATDPPVVAAPHSYNRSESAVDTRVAYGKGMSEWCSNCHSNGCSGTYGHVNCSFARLGQIVAANYNAYVKSGDINGMASRSFTSLVPFEEGTDSISLLAQHANSDGSYTNGPGPNANVMCLTCHRAHASAWDNMARWNMAAEFIVYKGAYPGVDNSSPIEVAQGRTSAETKKGYYDRPVTAFAAYQRSLCDKCHPRD